MKAERLFSFKYKWNVERTIQPIIENVIAIMVILALVIAPIGWFVKIQTSQSRQNWRDLVQFNIQNGVTITEKEVDFQESYYKSVGKDTNGHTRYNKEGLALDEKLKQVVYHAPGYGFYAYVYVVDWNSKEEIQKAVEIMKKWGELASKEMFVWSGNALKTLVLFPVFGWGIYWCLIYMIGICMEWWGE